MFSECAMTLDGPSKQLHFHMLSCLFQEDDMPEEVNIDDLIDLPNDEERVRKLQVTQKGMIEASLCCISFLATFQFIVMFSMYAKLLYILLPSHNIMLLLFFVQELFQKCTSNTEVCCYF